MKMSLKAARVNAGFTLDKASDLIKVSKVTMYRWETGITDPGILKAWELSKLYNLPIDMIAFDAPKNKKEV